MCVLTSRRAPPIAPFVLARNRPIRCHANPCEKKMESDGSLKKATAPAVTCKYWSFVKRPITVGIVPFKPRSITDLGGNCQSEARFSVAGTDNDMTFPSLEQVNTAPAHDSELANRGHVLLSQPAEFFFFFQCAAQESGREEKRTD